MSQYPTISQRSISRGPPMPLETHPDYRYKRVYVLMLSWADDDLNTEEEIKPLHDVLSSKYNYRVRKLKIPSKDSEDFLENCLIELSPVLNNPEVLFILYYGGHGDRYWNGLKWGTRGEHGKKPSKNLAPTPRIRWNMYQKEYLEKAKADVLTILDCCHAAAAIATSEFRSNKQPFRESGHTMEILAACGHNDGTLAPCRGSFSYYLTKELKSRAGGGPFTAARLHFSIVQRMMKKGNVPWSKISTPVYFSAQGSATAPSIQLPRLAEKGEEVDPVPFFRGKEENVVKKKGRWNRVKRVFLRR